MAERVTRSSSATSGPPPPPIKLYAMTERSLPELLAKGVLNSFVLLLSFTIFLVFLLGSYDYFKNVEDNKCSMTYMFEYPEYIRIKLESDMDKKYEKYGLYAYAEGKFTGLAMKHKFTGIPVLFVPGNAGSYKQVRSFASVALRKWLDSRTPYHFDFFSLDYNEELSGLYGYVLQSQAEYLAAAIERIQGFYDEYHSVALIGHSMGGIVAKTLQEHNEPLSNLIITLSTPHTRPILVFDPEQDLFYFHISRNWTRGDDKFHKDVTLISVGGGDRDVLVPEGFTKWGRHLDVHTTTTAVPAVWASTDHLCIVWCKQFVFSIVRTLFDLVEYRQPNGFYVLTEDTELRQKILDYHLIKMSSGKSFHSAHPHRTAVELGTPPGSGWNELLIHSYCSPPSRSTNYLMFPINIIKEKIKLGNPSVFKVMVLTTNTDAKNWIFGCTSQDTIGSTRYCSAADNLSSFGEIIPHFRRRRKVVHLKYTDISKYSHLIVRLDPFALKSCVNLDVYNVKERSKELNVKFETQNKMFYNLSLPLDAGIFSKLFAWEVLVHTGNSSCEGSHNSLAIFQHGNLAVTRFPRNETLVARISDWNATSANVQLYLEPSCKYTVQVRIASLETAGQIFRTYFRLLPSYFGSIILMSLYFQREATEWFNFHRVLISNAYNLTILPGFIVSILLAIVPNDWPHMLDGPEYFVILPMFCYLVAYALVLGVASGAWYLIIAFGNAVHAVFLRMLATRFARFTNLGALPLPDQLADMALDFTFTKFPVLISVFLISMTLATCGGFGLLAGLCFFIIKLFKMYEDILADLWRAKIHDVREGLSPLNFQFSFAMIWFLITAVNFPSLIHWVKSFSYDTSQWDVSMYLCLMILPTIAVLWQDRAPSFNPTLWHLHRFVFYIMGLAMVIWGTFRLYISGFILTIVLITTAMCQLISSIPLKPDEVEDESIKQENIGKIDTQHVSGEDHGEEDDESAESTDLDNEDFPEMRISYEKAFARERQEAEERRNHQNVNVSSTTSPEKQDQSWLEEVEDSSEELSESGSEVEETEDVDGEGQEDTEELPEAPKTEEQQERERRSRSKSKSSEKADLSQLLAEAALPSTSGSIPDSNDEITKDEGKQRGKNAQGDFNNSESESGESEDAKSSSKEADNVNVK